MSTTTNLCSCPACRSGAPYQWKVTLTGISNGTCGTCNSLNGDYVLSWNGTGLDGSCTWLLTFAPICTFSP